jgi:four helix bundle protein
VSQLRRASVSAVVNIVEGCARDPDREYRQFLNIACGSASELRYLLNLSHRLGLLSAGTSTRSKTSVTNS